MKRIFITLVFLALAPFHTLAMDLSDISNFRQYSEHFASSGQPNSDHLKLLAEKGVKRVIYLAYTDNDTAILAEDRKVLELDMDFVRSRNRFTPSGGQGCEQADGSLPLI